MGFFRENRCTTCTCGLTEAAYYPVSCSFLLAQTCYGTNATTTSTNDERTTSCIIKTVGAAAPWNKLTRVDFVVQSSLQSFLCPFQAATRQSREQYREVLQQLQVFISPFFPSSSLQCLQLCSFPVKEPHLGLTRPAKSTPSPLA